MAAILNLAASNPINAFPHLQIMMMMMMRMIDDDDDDDADDDEDDDDADDDDDEEDDDDGISFIFCRAHSVSVASNCFLNLILSVCPFAYIQI